MTKTEFLEYLEKKLHVLNQKEREDILSEYSQHIELKMESGLSEEDAIHDFGNLEELAAEILDAYNVNPDYDKKTIHIDGKKIGKSMARAGQKVGGIFNRGSRSVKRIFDKTAKGRFDLLLKCCLIIAVLFTAYLPLAGLAFWVGNAFYSIFGRPLDYMLSAAVIVGFHLFYLILSISVLHTFIMKYRRGGKIEEEDMDVEDEEGFWESGEEFYREGGEDEALFGDRHEAGSHEAGGGYAVVGDTAVQRAHTVAGDTAGQRGYAVVGDTAGQRGHTVPGDKAGNRPGARRRKGNGPFGRAAEWFRSLLVLPGFSAEERRDRPKRRYHFFRGIWNLIRTCAGAAVKVAVLCCIAPIFLFLIFLVVMFGTLIILVAMGYPLIGVTVMTLGGLLSGFAFIWFIWDILFSKKAGKRE